MPRRGKRGGARAPPGRPPPHLRSGRASDRPNSNSANAGPAGFTLQDEARSTAHRSSPWSADSRLRHRPVTFVSTGPIEPLKQLEEEILQHESTDPHDGEAHGREPKVLDTQDEAAPLRESESTSDDVQLPSITSGLGVGDVAASTTEDDTLDDLRSNEEDNRDNVEPEPEPEPESTAGAPASLPFFLDITRDKKSHRAPVRIESRSPSPAASDSSDEVILFKGRNKAAQAPKNADKPFNLRGIRTEIGVVEQTVKPSEANRVNISKRDQPKSRRQSMRDQKRQEEDELIADYIANMREHGDAEGLIPADAYSRRDIGGSLSEFENIEESFHTVAVSGDPKLASDDGSEPGDALEESDVITEDSDVDRTPKKRPDNGKNTRVNDTLLALLETDASCLDSLEHSHAEDGSPPLGTSDHDEDEDDIFNVAADRFANEIDDFDFMDWERPVLKRKKKGAKNRIPVFNISDSELEEKMQTAWSNDRMKKAEKKRERQALRTQGLLGKHANPEDLRVKYPDGMGLDQIAEELKAFLLGTNAILTLPPMDNHARKVIHELANKFNVKSKSTGSGDQRRPMLHRTFRTAKFAEETFDTAIARVGRKYFPRNDSALRAAVQRDSARRGGGGHAGVNYRDGEVVGGSAPELGLENKGRAMLEKMGWSSGTALGAINNKGILQPVAHVVKRSKAGLG